MKWRRLLTALICVTLLSAAVPAQAREADRIPEQLREVILHILEAGEETLHEFREEWDDAASEEAAAVLSFELPDGTVILDQDHIASAETVIQTDTAGHNEYYVRVAFDEEGTAIFAEATAELVGEHMNIRVDGDIVSAPLVQAPITGGECIISGNFTPEEADELAGLLNPGP